MEKLAEVEQTRFIERKEEAEAFTGAIPPLVKKKLDKKLEQFVRDTHVVVEHKGKNRDNVTLTIGDKKYTRKVDFSGDFLCTVTASWNRQTPFTCKPQAS